MLLFVTGASASGKSEYAEQQCLKLSEAPPEQPVPSAASLAEQAGERPQSGERIYLATMISQGEGSRERILRHRRLREGKGFQTVECPLQIGSAPVLPDSTVLLECLSNLLANEMFSCPGEVSEKTAQKTAERILQEVLELHKRTAHLIVVSNQVFSEGMVYDSMTEAYRRALGWLNAQLAQAADEAWEVVCGIPLRMR